MPNLGGLEVCPILKIKPSEIEFEGIFNGFLSLPLQDSNQWSSRLHYFTKELHYYNKVNLKGILIGIRYHHESHYNTLEFSS